MIKTLLWAARHLRLAILTMIASWAVASPLSASDKICINEIMYHPVEVPVFNNDGSPVLDLTEDVHEFIELRNYGTNTIALGGWEITGGIRYVFPEGVQILPDQYLVIDKNPSRLAVVPAYGLGSQSIYGPWQGTLSNSGETLRLKNSRGENVDLVGYSAQFPWPISADALGASERFTGLIHTNFQYRGRSLERVSDDWPGSDPANWIASPIPGEPSPGKPNSIQLTHPLPVITSLAAYQDSNEQPIIRQNQPVRIDAVFSSAHQLGKVQLEFFVDNINATNEPTTQLDMVSAGDSPNPRFTVLLPGQPDRSIVRYRIVAERAGVLAPISPRPDDPFRWHAYFVSPNRSTGNPVYDLFISDAGVDRLRTNISQYPPRVTLPDPPGYPRESWNATEPAVFICDGIVRDIHVRHHRSRYNIKTDTYKFFFPRYNRFNDQDTVLETDKGYDNVASYGIFRAAGLPAPNTRTINLYLNNNSSLSRLEIEDYDEHLLERYHQAQHALSPDLPLEKPGELYKSAGYIPAVVSSEGPYGPGDASLLPAIAPWWTPLQRYEWTYPIQDHDWKGEFYLKNMLDALWAARGDTSSNPNPNTPALRRFLEENFDVDKTLTYIAVLNWMGPWDDSTQNHFLWQQTDGKWCLLPWDCDGFMDGDKIGNSVFNGEVGDPSNNFRGPNFIKDSFIKAFRPELKERFQLLINTLLHPDNITALGYPSYQGFASSRNANVKQQLGLGDFQRPNQPVNVSPLNGASALPPDDLKGSIYGHTASPASAHATTTWEIRAANSTWSAPVLRQTSATNLTTFPIPFEILDFGRTYFWRCTYTDTNGHPSLASAPTAFTFGGFASGTQTNTTPLATIDNATLWRFNRSGIYPGTDWIQLTFNDSTWPQGAALIGYAKAGSNLPEPIRTQITNYTSAVTAYYFRYKFQFNGDPQTTTLQLTHVIDDGAVFYLNGKKLWSVRLPTDVTPSTFGDFVDVAVLEGPVDLPGSDLVVGENILAVEVHQCNANSGDIIFGATLKALTITFQGTDVVFNEIMADNRGAIGTGGNAADWIELYNNSAKTIGLDGWVLTDDVLKPTRFTFPTNSLIPAHGFITIWCDDATNMPGLHTGFGLSANGQTVVLMAPNNNGFTVKDTLVFGIQIPDYAIGRIPEGTGSWRLTVPTYGDRNQAQPTTNTASLKINEWMASPSSGDDWFELFNPQSLPVPLGGWLLSDSVSAPGTLRLAPLSFIAANGFTHFLADSHPENGAHHVDFKLSASGDTIALFTSNSVPLLIDSVSFIAQLTGVSQGRLPDGQPQIVSFPTTPTPGAPNYLPLTQVIINEVLSHSDPPYDDAIELFNPTTNAVPIGGWFLSDSLQQPKKFRIPDNLSLGPGGYAVFYENQFNADTNSPSSFGLSSVAGDEVVLSEADVDGNLTGFRTSLEFGPSESNIAFGRVLTSVGADFAPLARPTFGIEAPATVDEFHTGTGASNAPPLVGPAVLSEIMYRPVDRIEGTNLVDNTEDEYLEILNEQSMDLPLFDVLQPTNTWHIRGAVEFDFPTNIVLPPSGVVVIVGFDSATNSVALTAFCDRFAVPSSARILGPWRGKLGNHHESIRLLKPLTSIVLTPGAPDTTPYVLVEQVQYSNETPWPVAADGTGLSLHRIRPSVYGNDPANWIAAKPAPGRIEPAPRIDSIQVTPSVVTFQFMAFSGRAYLVEMCEDLLQGVWQPIEDVAAGQEDRLVTVTHELPVGSREQFYRVRTKW
jgi:hypothetical protein